MAGKIKIQKGKINSSIFFSGNKIKIKVTNINKTTCHFLTFRQVESICVGSSSIAFLCVGDGTFGNQKELHISLNVSLSLENSNKFDHHHQKLNGSLMMAVFRHEG